MTAASLACEFVLLAPAAPFDEEDKGVFVKGEDADIEVIINFEEEALASFAAFAAAAA